MSVVATPSWRSPYPGLSSFGEQDADFFFGREREAELLRMSVAARPLTLLYGPSGSGKSSLLSGGVVYRLRAQAVADFARDGAADLVPVTCRAWHLEPVGDLVAAIEAAVGALAGDRIGPWPEDPLDVVQVASGYIGGELVLILDQFEEFFRYGADERFAGVLARITRGRHASILLSMREDELGSLDRLADSIPGVFDHRIHLEHLDRDQARAAIIGPLEALNRVLPADEHKPPVMIEPGLVEAILDQLSDGHGRVEAAFLQLLCSRLWADERERGSSILHFSTLEQVGGAREVIATFIDRAISALTPRQQELAERTFNFLVTPSGAKIALPASDLAAYAGAPEEEMVELLRILSGPESRLVRPVAPRSGTASYYEIFHDLIGMALREWRERAATARLARERQEAQDRARLEARRARRFRLLVVALTLLLVGYIVLLTLQLHARGR